MMFAPLGVALLFGFKAATMDVEKSKTLLWVYSALNGVSLSTLAFIYTGDSIIRTFFITSSVFAAMSLYGYTTKKDLTSVGSFLIMGLFGLIIASLANLFFQSAAVHFATSLLGVFIFMGLIAWDTQKLKAIYFSVGGGEMGQRMSVVGAFNLYLDFINMFIYLLRFFGERRNNN
jgi:FtsH-binding integral membrane protein